MIARRLLLLLLALGLCPGAFSGPALAAELVPASLILQWRPQAQFAGFYVAQELGFYRDEGVNMTILPGGPERQVVDYLTSGKATFGTMFLSRGMELRAKGSPVVNIAQVVQRSALMLVAKAKSGIRTVRDLAGKRIGLWGDEFRLQPLALFRQLGIDVTIVPQGFSLTLFLLGGVDVCSAMWYNEYHYLIGAGLDPGELVPFFFHELGLNFPEDGIYALEKTCRENPGLCRAVARASLRGWQYAFEHPEEALEIVLKQMHRFHAPASIAHQRWMLARMRDIVLDGQATAPTGVLKRADFDLVARILVETGLIKAAPDFEAFFKGPRDDQAAR